MSDLEIIREAVPSDVSRIVEMGRRFLLEGPYKDQLADKPVAAAQYAASILGHPQGHIIVAEHDGQVIGVIALVVAPHPMSGEMVAVEMIWYVEPEHRPGGIAMKLRWEAEKLAKSVGAKWISFTAPIPKGELTLEFLNLFKRFGDTPIEVACMKRLN